MSRLYSEFAVGQRFRTPGRTIMEVDTTALAGVGGDDHPVRTGELFAATESGGRIAHGPVGIGLATTQANQTETVLQAGSAQWGAVPTQ